MDVGDVTQLFGSFLTIFLNFKSLLALEAIAEKFWPGTCSWSRTPEGCELKQAAPILSAKKKGCKKSDDQKMLVHVRVPRNLQCENAHEPHTLRLWNFLSCFLCLFA